MGRYCGEDYGPAPTASNANDFVGSDRLAEAVRRRDALIASTGLDWRVIQVAFGHRVDRGLQSAVAPWMDPFDLAARYDVEADHD